MALVGVRLTAQLGHSELAATTLEVGLTDCFMRAEFCKNAAFKRLVNHEIRVKECEARKEANQGSEQSNCG